MILIATLVLVSLVLGKVLRLLLPRYISPIRLLNGPQGTNWIAGNLREIRYNENPFDEWLKEYGPTFTYKGFFCTNQLFTMDTRAVAHILSRSNDYQKPSFVRFYFGQFFGEGLITVESDQHRQQRRIMNPAFGPAQVRAITDVFLANAVRLRDLVMPEISQESAESSTGQARRNVLSWMNNVTLDIIGLTGFGYNFDALNSTDASTNELHDAFATLHSATEVRSIFPFLQAWLPALRLLGGGDRGRRIEAAHRTMSRVSKELLSDAQAAARAGGAEKGDVDKNGLNGRDLLSLLVKANMATDIPENQRLSEEHMLAQVPTFLFVGHGTTSTAIAWALFAMTNSLEAQAKLREELLTVETETPSMDELNALPYLDAVVRETLRVHAPVPSTVRIAMKDDVVPLEKPVMDRNGVVHDSIQIRKGDPILIPILSMNRSTELWGPDAGEFKPERWTNVPESALRVPGVWGNMLTFLSGPRACIGYRFSIVEMKVLLFVLIRAFEFEPAVPAKEITTRWTVAQRPVLRSDPTAGSQLPLLVKPYNRTTVVE